MLHLSAGQIPGMKAAVHSVHYSFQQDDTEAVLLVDASITLNSFNQKVAIENISRLCPSLSTIRINSYRYSPELFVDGYVLYPMEDATRNDPHVCHCNCSS